MAEEIKDCFVCKITLQTAKRAFILAGTPFAKDAILESTFDALVKSGEIIPASQAPAPVTGPRPLISVPERPVPTGKDKNFKVVDPEIEAQKAADKAAKQAEKDAAAAKKQQEKLAKKMQADSVFNANPADLQEHTFEVLSATYFDICKKYGVEPVKLATKEEVIAQLSSQYVADLKK